MSGVNDMLNQARSSLGLGEPNHIQRWYQKRNGSAFAGNFAWCAASITYWAVQSGNYDVVNHGTDYAYTVWFAQRFQKHGEWYPGTDANVRRAKPGDIVFFDWSGTNEIGRIDHVGIVEKNLGGGRVQTIEGNIGNMCRREVRTASTIAGYGRPKYKTTAPSIPPVKPPAKKTFEDLVVKRFDKKYDGRVRMPLVDLRKGKKGPHTVWLQDALNVQKKKRILDTDGDFGPATERAVKAFQIAHFLTPDGVYGPKTRAKLREALGRLK